MADQTHQYETNVEWTEGLLGTLNAAPRSAIPIGAPPELGGSAEVWSPEHLCTAAVNACVMLTFMAIAANSKVPIRGYAAAATGTLEKAEGRGPVITRVVVKPRITLAADADRAKVERLIKMAERNCYISNSMNAAVTVEAEIVVG